MDAGNLLNLSGDTVRGTNSGSSPSGKVGAISAIHPETRGMWLGLIGVAIFSLTLPFTRLAVAELDPLFVALGRAVLAALCAGVLLWKQGATLPTSVQWRALGITSLGVVIGFPVFSSIAMQSVPASHGAIVLGILPLATA